MWGDIAIAFLLAFITAFVITPYTMRLAAKVGAIDVPNERRINKVPMPRLGGIAVISGFFVSIIYLIVSMVFEKKINLFDQEQYYIKLLGFFAGIVILAIVCYIDDVRSIHPLAKLSGQIVAAVIVVVSGIRIENINIPFLENAIPINEILTYVITIGWIVGITNAINLIDGLDGLSSGITLISCLSLLIIFALNGTSLIAIILITALARCDCRFSTIQF